MHTMRPVDCAIASAYWPARFEILSEEPLVIYDGAHNPQGIAGAVENIAHYLVPMTADGKVVLLMGVMADKDHDKMTAMLAPYAHRVFSVTPANERSLSARGVGEEFERFGIATEAFENLADGVHRAMDYAEKEKRPMVCLGSLYMYADVKSAVKDR